MASQFFPLVCNSLKLYVMQAKKKKKKEGEREKLRGTDTQGLISDLPFLFFCPKYANWGRIA